MHARRVGKHSFKARADVWAECVLYAAVPAAARGQAARREKPSRRTHRPVATAQVEECFAGFDGREVQHACDDLQQCNEAADCSAGQAEPASIEACAGQCAHRVRCPVEGGYVGRPGAQAAQPGPCARAGAVRHGTAALCAGWELERQGPHLSQGKALEPLIKRRPLSSSGH